MSEIEKELLKATGLKVKADGSQKYLRALVKAVQGLDDDDWDGLSKDAQDWVNAGAQSVNDSEDIDAFPDAEKEEKDGDKKKDKDAPRSRRGRARDEEENDEGDEDEDNEGEDDDDGDDSGDEGDAEEEEGEEEVTSKNGKRGAAKKTAAKKTAAKKTTSKPAKADDKKAKAEDKKPARAADNKPPKPRAEGAQVLIKRAVIGDPKSTTESIVAKLEKKGFDVTTSAVSTIRSGTLQTLRLVKEIGMPKGDF